MAVDTTAAVALVTNAANSFTMETAAGFVGLALYAAFNEWRRSRTTAERKSAVSGLETQMQDQRAAIEEQSARHEKEIAGLQKMHARELVTLEESIRAKTDLVLLEREIYEEERQVSREEYLQTVRDLVEGKLSVLHFDITQRFRSITGKKHTDFICPQHGGCCNFSAGFIAAQVTAYDASLGEAIKKGAEIARLNVGRNGYNKMSSTELETRLVNENKDVHRAVWDYMIDNFPHGLLEQPDLERVPETFTLTYYREMIGSIMRAKTTEQDRIHKARSRYETALKKIYNDRRVDK